jgi:ferric-dicitrate binding protein FerR (iron transport regulator)
MNSKEPKQDGNGHGSPELAQDDVLESLFDHVGARPKAPQADEQEVRNALHREWRAVVQQKRRRTYMGYGMAASVLLAAVIGFSLLNQPVPAPLLQQVATVEKQSGNIFVHMSGQDSSASRRLGNRQLYSGQVLSTAGNARLAITMPGGEMMRVDQNSSLVFHSERRIELQQGRVYVDSGNDAGNSAAENTLEIATFAGVVRHIGTLYMTGIEPSSVTVSIREGQVLFEQGSASSMASAGEQFQVDDNGNTSVTSIPTHGDEWQWTELITPEFDLDGRSAFDFIQWAGRETGRQVSFVSEDVERLAQSTVLRGSIDLEPMRALELILQTSDLQPFVENSRIIIRRRAGT